MSTYPHIDKAWADAFITEARVRDVTGSAIGSALAEVEAHCADSGEAAADALGDPAAYAAALALPRNPGRIWPAVAGGALSIVALLVGPASVRGLLSNTPVVFSTGSLLVAALVAAGLVALAVWGAPIIRAIAGRPLWQGVVAGLLPTAAFLALLIALPGVALAVPAAAAGAVAGASFVAGPIVSWIGLSIDRDSQITAPGEPPTQTSLVGRLVPVLLLPVCTVLLVVMVVLTR